MTLHPLIDQADAKPTRQAKEFRDVAASLTGEMLAEAYRQELHSAPNRGEAGKRYLGVHPKKPPVERRSGRDEEHLGMALVAWARARGAGLELPDGGAFEPVDHQVPLFVARPERGETQDPNAGVDRVELIGLGPDDRLALVALKYVEPGATRTGTGETPLRFFLRALAHTAIAAANRKGLAAEVEALCGRAPSEAPPALYLIATPRYWELCRKREAQKGAGWIKEMERLARECEEVIGVPVRFLSLSLDGDPGWLYGDEGPALEAAPTLGPAWERNAGRVRPRTRPRSRRPATPEDLAVEADLSRPIRPYGITGSFAPGDRIQHPTLGVGVVQGEAGPGKIHVLFGERKSLLVHERPPQGA